jgi:arylamine N-acetyltransferase
MHEYTPAQLSRYLSYIGLKEQDVRGLNSSGQLGRLTVLQRHHMARVPFESLSLHYSRTRLLSLEPDDLYKKIVENGRGGYCMEVNAFFASVLRGTGFTLFSAGARVNGPAGYKGW